mgnify:CR=1 FL=1
MVRHLLEQILFILTCSAGSFLIPSERTPTRHCFLAIAYSSFQSTSFKEPGISLAEPILNRKKSKKIFCCFNIKLYFCTHEREITKSHRSYNTDAPIHYITSYIGSLHSHSLAVQDYPKIFSAINLAGNSKPAIT